jgi:hypothetical protein
MSTYKDALQSFERSLAVRIKTFGDKHRLVARSMLHIGKVTYDRLGRCFCCNVNLLQTLSRMCQLDKARDMIKQALGNRGFKKERS